MGFLFLFVCLFTLGIHNPLKYILIHRISITTAPQWLNPCLNEPFSCRQLTLSVSWPFVWVVLGRTQGLSALCNIYVYFNISL